ncbi:MAG: MotA/TolQ/ExbB proton channel family protein [Gammaproteobacteria bacterium]
MLEFFSPWSVLTDADPVVQLVLLLLVMASILTWGIVLERWLYLARLSRANFSFVEAFWSGQDLVGLYQDTNAQGASGVIAIFTRTIREYLRLIDQQADRWRSLESIQRVLRIMLSREERELSRRLPILALIASTAPYVGLFGTVWGVIDSFRGIGNAGQATLVSMAPGIAEALVATALGLFAAIPAAVAHNLIGAAAGRQGGEMEDFAEDLLAVLEQQFPEDD